MRKLKGNLKIARRKAFTQFLNSVQTQRKPDLEWRCCEEIFHNIKAVCHHVSKNHQPDLIAAARTKDETNDIGEAHDDMCSDGSSDVAVNIYHSDLALPWLPHISLPCVGDGEIVLYYKYRDLDNVDDICAWQEELARRLGLTGKIRVASEGINGTVGGSYRGVELYIESFLKHPAFHGIMKREDFKRSPGNARHFSAGLQVKKCDEIVAIGLEPNQLPASNAAKHVSVDDFHSALQNYAASPSDQVVFLDVRNYYEHRIGKFRDALTPDLRKFSYFPEFVDHNSGLFTEKTVYMYCTGGIRCERASAYLRSKDICKEVYQLDGGIHKYIEKYPNGGFRGKLFVFDDRFSIPSNGDILSECIYCSAPWDKYQRCSSRYCSQLVLSCDNCRRSDGLTACCKVCQNNAAHDIRSEECECTQNRSRIPVGVRVDAELQSHNCKQCEQT